MDSTEKILLGILVIILPITSTKYEYEIFSEYYYFSIRTIKHTKGIVKEISSVTDIGLSTTHEYEVEYFLNASRYTFKEILSPDSLAGIKSGDSVLLSYSQIKPSRATLKNDSYRLKELTVAVAILILWIYMVSLFRKFISAYSAGRKIDNS